MVWITTDLDVELSEFDDEDIRAEAEARGMFNNTQPKSELIQKLHDAYILKQTTLVDRLLRELFHDELGRLV